MTILDELDEKIGKQEKLIADIETKLADAKAREDNFAAINLRDQLAMAKRTLSNLSYRRRCELPAGSGGDGRTTGYFYGGQG